ncbi:hypothetical protein [Actinomadura bangladeshensis]|uniref:DUF3040 domain-containing protein n=1 Tax=Actinomadura bangladeshensis TaxID=453573 RepID=A0A4R4P0U4_9ACTN|nr:hypothetical protein [Actinomadura bangladeshensis]TDC13492.1 hypothetical protein E1284_20120 [Actinomadura bangladeshensis]
MAEDDFRRWERELDRSTPEEGGLGGRVLVLTAGIIAIGCAALIVMGDVPLGAAGLVLSSVILLLWRIGM